MSKTVDNLKNAFAGESQANRRYTAFARKADSEGFTQVAKLFRAAAEAETVHALSHLRILGEIKSTLENLGAAVSGETFEYSKMYPEYLEIAQTSDEKRASWSFDVAMQVEKIHAGLYKQAQEAIESGKDLETPNYYVCDVCGNTFENKQPEKCPICNATSFIKI